jgi:hypothetical protein
MPFPLAHPAAVLPLRRFCPRWLDFPALIIGSVVPDAGYLIDPAHVGIFSHRLIAGTLGFCLPIGLSVWLIFDRLRDPVLVRLPQSCRAAFPARIPLTPWAPASVLLSLGLGTFTHWVLDSSTHWNGCFVLHSATLHRPLFRMGHQPIMAFDGLYYVCTFLGTMMLSATYLHWLSRTTQLPPLHAASVRWGSAMLVGAAVAVVAWNCRTDQPWLSGLIVLSFVLGFAALTALALHKSSGTVR